jgi:phage shock protein PspC (stress-responsive transcriptional regulator)
MIYIVGIGRSGSTLLTSILNNHSQVKAIPEVPFILFFSRYFGKIQSKSLSLEDQTKEYLNVFQKIRPKSIVNISNQFPTNFKYNTYIEFCERVLDGFEIINSKGMHQVYVDKNPQYSLFIPQLRKIDPNAKFIFLVRDYRDNVLSRTKKKNNKPLNIAYNAFRNRFFLKALKMNLKKQDCIIIQYEKLVTDSKATIRELCEFINIPFEESMLNPASFEESQLEVSYQPLNRFMKDHFLPLTQSINSTAAGKWKNTFSEKERKCIEGICGNIGHYFGYQKSTSHLPYFFLIIGFLPQYLLAKWHLVKAKFIYFLPPKIKINRLRKQIENGRLR